MFLFAFESEDLGVRYASDRQACCSAAFDRYIPSAPAGSFAKVTAEGATDIRPFIDRMDARLNYRAMKERVRNGREGRETFTSSR